MKPITIAEKLKPFSHLPGTSCLLPGTHFKFELFPALVRIYELVEEEKLIDEIPIPVHGPVKDFTVQLDLERAWIRVWGTAKGGYFRYKIIRSGAHYQFIDEKQNLGFESKVPLDYLPLVTSKLSLGSNKAQDWELVKRRHHLAEVFPHWHRLGSFYHDKEKDGYPTLLSACKSLTYETFLNLFSAGFDGILAPRAKDQHHLGFSLPLVEGSPLKLLSQASTLIQSMFISSSADTIVLMPNVPSQFHCGRLVNVELPDIGTIDIEWTKKKLFRMCIKAHQTKKITLIFPKELDSFRLNGNEILPCNACEIAITAENVYSLDRFQK